MQGVIPFLGFAQEQNRRLMKLLSEQMLDVAAPEDPVGNTSDAPCSAERPRPHKSLI
jgi:hypothetical protein